jgi:hypothetical protein
MKEVSPKLVRGNFEVVNHRPAEKESINLVSLNPISVVRLLGVLAFLLLLINIGFQLTIYVTGKPDLYGSRFFYFDSEDNLPAAYSTLLILFSALLLTIITVLKKNQSGAMTFHWAVLSAGFLFMAIDEELSLHEELIEPTRAMLGDHGYGIFYYAWVIPAIILVVVLGLFFLKFLNRLPAKTRLHFLVAGAVYLGGCIGVELIGGRYDELYGKKNLTYSLISTFEESFEMTGIIIFIWALLVYIAETTKQVQFHVEGPKERVSRT